MMQGLINGIKSMIGNISSTVSNVASTVRSYLHFSCPDVGPLADYESWMPDFMKGLAKGIKDNSGLVSSAISDLSGGMKLAMETPELKNIKATAVPTAQPQVDYMGRITEMFNAIMNRNENNEGDIVIPVYVGGNAIDEIVVRAEERRKLRSGGNA